jgi:pyrroloquinoline quinone biosynthesis protein B
MRAVMIAGGALALSFGCSNETPAADPEAPGPPPASTPAVPPAALAASPSSPAAVETVVDSPRLRILGIAQDGGLPHAGCACDRCEAAASDPAMASGATSLAVLDPGPSQHSVFLVDASPQLPAQLRLLRDVRPPPTGGTDRQPLDGVLLTHAHIGHYTGLMHLGFEVLSTHGTPIWATPAMTRFLSTHAPWSQLVKLENVAPRPVEPGTSVDLTPSIRATPMLVPHRDEFADTVAWRFTGPNATIVFVPDTDPWARWTDRAAVEAVFEGADVALVDGTFYSANELPGRDLSTIGHPLIVDSMSRLEARRAAGMRVIFIHLNHSNPAILPDSEARAAIEAAGFEVAQVGDEIML